MSSERIASVMCILLKVTVCFKRVNTCMCCAFLAQGFAQEILSDLVEDTCLGLCFEVHRAVKQGYLFLDDTDQESMKDFGERFTCFLNMWDSGK